ncbi:DUF202 domain-containing protein [Streptomyces pactum]|uniref:DUF202 domain-containing protein n=1 Tax=Streptomyces pactum TaxID=68249 RepID=A0ABS0NG56_9ACTN|nr:DUF202 domain-containing protein [Streptomyces pactum]MBH5334099.1 DUF202 domain-containing protein [Streptomyces pactum]
MAEAGRDPGLQPERTRLAWRRTTLTCAVVGVLGLRQALRDGPGAGALAAVVLIVLVWLVFLGVAHRRMRHLAVPLPAVLGVRSAGVAAACAVALVVCGVAVLM